ncbi:ribosomal protein S18 acetylase RimI-like enzyme [Lewinella marina]|uniref:GNAT family N-acetyltransferase n=1 Tax=Neolewinella marina TaxID=438751 RepID=A0A2G0CBI2_9BACT|nr:GNAT family N-acetyltransferase [Neolewinella marina]NJB87160.1 ribosomal protein S18 acetylase RimI-like enzyme [Neolewinella marina]PHK97315.1 GNAT family N-acetyltransferase [Neolewinella marina]
MLQPLLRYRPATPFDAPRIAALHTRSWRENYRGAMTDDYLDGQAADERLGVWTQRFSEENPNMQVFLAESGVNLVGFCCLFLDHDSKDGTLLDNLHVHIDYRGRGVGKQLMHWAAKTTMAHDPAGKLYLWVLQQNTAAAAVYRKLGGRMGRREQHHMPGTAAEGTPALAVHFDPADLRERTR